jgi:hypothetical protein
MLRQVCAITLLSVVPLLSYGAQAVSVPKASCRTPEVGERATLVNGRSLVIPDLRNLHLELAPGTCRLRALSATIRAPYKNTVAVALVNASFVHSESPTAAQRSSTSKVAWIVHRDLPVFIDASPVKQGFPAILLKKEFGRPLTQQIFSCTVTGGDLSGPKDILALEKLTGYCYSAISSDKLTARISLSIAEVPYAELVIPEIFRQLELD